MDGRNVRIICTDAKDIYTIIALIECGDVEETAQYSKDGKYYLHSESDFDLYFAPEKHEGWLNIYRGESGFYLRGNPYKSKEEADKVAKANYKTFCTTVKIEWEE